jgi:tetratricopeptide (TPR) repeat protein
MPIITPLAPSQQRSLEHFNSARHYCRQEKYEEALQQLNLAVECNPYTVAPFVYRYALMILHLGARFLSDLEQAIHNAIKTQVDFFQVCKDFEADLSFLKTVGGAHAARILIVFSYSYNAVMHPAQREYTLSFFLESLYTDPAIIFSCLTMILQVDPRNAAAWVYRSVAQEMLDRRDDFQDSHADFKQAMHVNAAVATACGEILEQCEKTKIAYLLLSAAFYAQQEPTRAFAEYTQIIVLAPKNIRAYEERGDVSLAANHVDAARRSDTRFKSSLYASSESCQRAN